MANTPSKIQPVTTGASNFVDVVKNEVANTVTGGAKGGNARVGLCEVLPNRDLKRRKIYAWVYVQGANAYVRAQINFYRDGQQVGSLPISGQSGTPAGLNESLLCACTTGGNAIGDTIGLFVTNPVDQQPLQIPLQPQYLYGIFDKADVSITDQSATVTYVRLFLAILSN